ncbi:heme NO-binding domain-containing protein [Agaribacterium haliotis]|uniref:heme NO-binding domain-containing protein n=1 Tax=Agaribacterium haliotis TaxID=2013869 RepID=UPI001304731E|nr:heme NO-binding domain-containing protein [Agaribacterium haliotis]
MKGIVFTEFMEMVEQNWGVDMVDDLIDSVAPESGGAYTSVASYDYEELVAYVAELSKRTQQQAPALVHAFGNFLAASFVKKFRSFFDEAGDCFSLLKKIDDHIHVEVRKLYPDAELPKFSYEQASDSSLILHYESSRQLADLAHGLIEGCARHYGEQLKIERSGSLVDGLSREDFVLSKLS